MGLGFTLLRSQGDVESVASDMVYMEVEESSEHVVELAGARSQSRAFPNGMSPKEWVGRKWF
jgi:hypothetical protein